MEILKQPYMMAFWFGAFSALSLPLGALLGAWIRFSGRAIAAIMAFGAGALIAAITYELIEPAVERTGFWPLSIGCIIGCAVFVIMDQILSNQGAFMRKSSTLMAHLRTKKKKQVRKMIAELSKVDILRSMPPEEIQEIVPHIEGRSFVAGERIFDQENYGDAMYIIESGKVRIERGVNCAEGGERIADLGPGETFGEMALLWHAPRTATAIAETDVKTWEIHREDFNELLEASPSLKAAVTGIAEFRRNNGKLPDVRVDAAEWEQKALESIREENLRPTAVEIKKAETEGGSSTALAMWLGIFLDSIPESLVIGASMTGAKISAALIVGLFLANLPESMSSATMMKRRGSRTGKIFWMWMSIMILIGVGALTGNLTFKGVAPSTHSIFEGLAAGSMLAMTAQTMLPEAFEQGGWLVGALTVLGFLAAIFFQG
jgi:zinc transporter ZupT